MHLLNTEKFSPPSYKPVSIFFGTDPDYLKNDYSDKLKILSCFTFHEPLFKYAASMYISGYLHMIKLQKLTVISFDGTFWASKS